MDEEISGMQARIEASTARLLGRAAKLDDGQVREPSLLPGWSRGHVLTHIARNADGLANLLRWARTGTEIPMYASRQARIEDIEAGARRPLAALLKDVRVSAAAFAAELARMPAGAWAAPVRALAGGPFPAREVPLRRLSEVEIHHVDLGTGYLPGDWPAGFVARALPRAARSFQGRDGVPACLLRPEGTTQELRIGGDGPALTITGPATALLAWLTGRATGQQGGGEGLRVAGNAALPVLPAWG